ncbi:hypothetical protein SNE40_004411 [Patella caerulea]|uniref:Uncharacterized protein n=1 Tax=Patella caerulea TaxID=87958 RepID=A0AAN8Q5E4_PATCE
MGRGSVKSGAIDILRVRDRSFFLTVVLDLDSSLKGDTSKVKRSVVYCHDLTGLIDHVIEFRGGSVGEYMIKVGIDGGGSFQKFCVNIIRTPDATAKYSEGTFASKFVDGGEKKLLIIAIVEAVTASYDNLTAILDLLGIDRVDFLAAFDMKLANVFFGLGPHSSACPCPWCELPKNQFSNPDRVIVLRTLGGIRKNAAEYEAAVQKHERAKPLSAPAFKSCTHQPLTKNLPDETLIIDILPDMELQIFLGITNRLYDLLLRGFSVKANSWSEHLAIRRPPMHGGEFNGQQCKRLLENIPVLEELLENAGESGLRIVNAFSTFNDVRHSCFGMTVQGDYKDSIDKFEIAYRELGLQFTSKCHAVVDHISQFLERQGDMFDCENGLGFWSEQASESVHSDFKSLSDNGYKRDLNHSAYAVNLLRCTTTYNSRHR